MEAVLKNVASTVELLAVTRTDKVEQWDTATVDKAFQWARYCEHIYTRFHTNPPVKEILEKHLLVTNEGLRTTFHGSHDTTFSDLSQCQYLLLVGLLNNPSLPRSIQQMLFNTQSPRHNGKESKDLTGHCIELIQCKSACKVFGALLSSTPSPHAEVQGMMLMERLDALLCTGSKTGLAEQYLDSFLQTSEGLNNISEVMVAALLTKKNDADAAGRVLLDFVLDWLLRNRSLIINMCSIFPVVILSGLALRFVKFRVAYCGLLKEFASNMEYDITEGEWVQTHHSKITFNDLSNHFRALFEACPTIKEDTMKELNHLKTSDGDFEVEGLSIWGDLLLELK
ncbi:Fanconi anemia group F protein [Aplochiton taeniatus]